MTFSGQPLRCLLVEDMEDDAKLVLRELRAGGYDVTWERVETAETMRAALAGKAWDVVLSDYQMPSFSGLRALEVLRTTGQDLPFIIVSGTIGERVAVDCMKAGAHDYLMKDALARLAPAIQRELREASDRRKHRAAEESLRQNEKRFRSFFESSNVGMSLTQLSGRVHVNRAMCDMLGYSETEFSQLTWQAVTHPDDLARTQGAIEDLLAGKHSNVRMSKRYLHKNGSVVWGNLSSTLLRDDAGRPQYLLTTVIDVTEQRQSEDALRQNEERYRMITENASDLIWLYDLKAARFDYISPSVERLLGYTSEELRAAELTTVLTPASAAEARATLGRRIAALAQGDLSELRHIGRYEHVRKDGSIMIGEVTSTALLDQAGQPIKILGVARDITEREQTRMALEESEKRFRTIFERAGVGVAMVTLDGQFADVNERLCQIVGYSREELLAKRFQEITYADDLAYDLALVRQIVAGKTPGFAVEKRYVRKDGSLVWVYLTVAIVRAADDRPLHFISVIEDLTERKRAELALQTSEQRFKSFMDQIPGLAYIKDAKGRTIFASKGFATLLGMRAEDVVGKQSADFFPAEFAQKIDAEDQEVLASGVTMELEEEYRDRVWMTRKFPIPLAGSEPLLGGVTLDVTERRKAEKALAAREEIFSSIVGQANDALALIDAETGQFMEFNRAAHEDLGYTREEFAGFRIRDIQAHHDQEQIREHIRQIQKEGGHTFETLHRHRNGELRHVRISARPMKLHGRDYLTAVWGDITQAKEAEAALKRSAEELSLRNQALTRFNQAVVGRELRMIDLKREINELCGRLHEAPRYRTPASPLPAEKETAP